MNQGKKTLMVLAITALVAVAGVSLALALYGQSSPKTRGLTWVRHPAEPFSVTATEISVAQFRACVQAGACQADTVNPICNFGTAGRDRHPLNCVTYFGAEQFCAFAGGRVCTEEEWLSACRGQDGRAFPYGNVFDLDACNVRSATNRVKGQAHGTVPVASKPCCVGGLDGLFDMAGNVAEWVGNCKGSYCKFRGAGFISNDPVERFAACKGVCAGNDKSLKSAVVGIRCCKDAKSNKEYR
ncbi:MAG TPA: SUMF1/EgtB/PvdO family nonheme iron enzyme [Myxococcota bacterium]|nr:SUMF1/EgtB/PvdO family nonheme iron enzyme [Myxococcota bacterium]